MAVPAEHVRQRAAHASKAAPARRAPAVCHGAKHLAQGFSKQNSGTPSGRVFPAEPVGATSKIFPLLA